MGRPSGSFAQKRAQDDTFSFRGCADEIGAGISEKQIPRASLRNDKEKQQQKKKQVLRFAQDDNYLWDDKLLVDEMCG
ncbi:MAG: hypothetical protein P4L10_10840 [Acidobacteriaceae bacterium]|nr:hypothetical protein [Acidobacteriaceae bacterium]